MPVYVGYTIVPIYAGINFISNFELKFETYINSTYVWSWFEKKNSDNWDQNKSLQAGLTIWSDLYSAGLSWTSETGSGWAGTSPKQARILEMTKYLQPYMKTE